MNEYVKMALCVLIAVVCLIYLLVTTFVYDPFTSQASPAAQASEQGFCAQDPSHDHLITFADIGMFTAAFGQQNLELDYAPIPLGDGVISFGEIGGATSIFGQTCLGIWSGSAATPENMGLAAKADGIPGDYPEIIEPCSYNIWFPGYEVLNGIIYVTAWGGGVGCWHGAGAYTMSCSIQIRQLHGQEWQTVLDFGTGEQSGTHCEGNYEVVQHSLDCYMTAGWYYHYIQWASLDPPGPFAPWHIDGHWMLADWSQSFNPCG